MKILKNERGLAGHQSMPNGYAWIKVPLIGFGIKSCELLRTWKALTQTLGTDFIPWIFLKRHCLKTIFFQFPVLLRRGRISLRWSRKGGAAIQQEIFASLFLLFPSCFMPANWHLQSGNNKAPSGAFLFYCGEGGIRTRGTVTRTTV